MVVLHFYENCIQLIDRIVLFLYNLWVKEQNLLPELLSATSVNLIKEEFFEGLNQTQLKPARWDKSSP